MSELPAAPSGKNGWPWEPSIKHDIAAKYGNEALPRISIVTPSYNQGPFLEETIRSVLLQHYPNLEYIVIDGGSTDNSREILEKYDRYINYWVSEPDKGQPDALNKGFARATGAILAFINSDDLYAPGALHRVAADYMGCADKERFFAYYPVCDFSSQGPEYVHLPRFSFADDRYYWVTGRANIHQPGTFWRAELLKAAGGFDSSLQYAFDRKFFMQLIGDGILPALYEGPAIACFRIHGGSKTDTEYSKPNESNRFLREFAQINSEMLGKLTLRERLQLRKARKQWAMSALYSGLHSAQSARFPVILAYAGFVLRYPEAACSRFFWGTFRRLVFFGK